MYLCSLHATNRSIKLDVVSYLLPGLKQLLYSAYNGMNIHEEPSELFQTSRFILKKKSSFTPCNGYNSFLFLSREEHGMTVPWKADPHLKTFLSGYTSYSSVFFEHL